MFFIFLYFLLMMSLFKMVLRHSAEVLSSVPRLHALQRIYVLDTLLSGMSYSAIGCEFNVNESTIYIK